MSHVWIIEYLEDGEWSPGYVLCKSREEAREDARENRDLEPSIRQRVQKYVRAR